MGRLYSGFRTTLCTSLFNFLVFHVSPFWYHLFYFLLSSLFGFLALKFTNTRNPSFKLDDFDLFFTSVSATTVSSMSTVEIEVFSNSQLMIITVLMLLGGPVFTSMLGLLFRRLKFPEKSGNIANGTNTNNGVDHGIELRSVVEVHPDMDQQSLKSMAGDENNSSTGGVTDQETRPPTNFVINVVADHRNHHENDDLKYRCIKCLGYVVLGYLLVIHVVGSGLISLYLRLIPSAYNVLKERGFSVQVFSVFLTVSTFASCGFVPTNENMIVFAKNSGLLLLLIPQILLGNSLYPLCLRLVIWMLKRITKKEEYVYMLVENNGDVLGYGHLMSKKDSILLSISTVGFIVVQFVLFCALEWNSGILDGVVSNNYQKVIASMFQTVNTRHTGESVVDFSKLSPAFLVVVVIMMYLPAYTFFKPIEKDEEFGDKKKSRTINNMKKQARAGKKKRGVHNSLLPQVSYLAIFIIIICITERKKLKDDPLNFSVFNIIIEVISAYASVGFTTSYSCKRRLINLDEPCKDAWYGFVGRWSKGGKFILILVMFFGRHKKFSLQLNGGKAWKLL